MLSRYSLVLLASLASAFQPQQRGLSASLAPLDAVRAPSLAATRPRRSGVARAAEKVASAAAEEDDFLGGDIRPQPAEVDNLGAKVVGPPIIAARDRRPFDPSSRDAPRRR